MTLVDMTEYTQTHLKWYDNGKRFRVRLRPRWTDADLTDLGEDAASDDEYDASVRNTQGSHREYASIVDRVTFELNRSIMEGSNALVHNPDTTESNTALREVTKRFISRCRKLVAMLGCASPSAIDVHAPGASIQASGAAASLSFAGGSTSHVSGSSRHVDESEESEDELQDKDQEEMNLSQMLDAPIAKVKRVSRPPSDPLSPTPFQRERRRRKKTVNEGCSKRGRK